MQKINYSKPIYVAHVYSDPDTISNGRSFGWHEYGYSNNIYTVNGFVDQFVKTFEMCSDMLCVVVDDEASLKEVVYKEFGYDNICCDNIIRVVNVGGVGISNAYVYTTESMYESDSDEAYTSILGTVMDMAVCCLRLKALAQYLNIDILEFVPLLDLIYNKYIFRVYCLYWVGDVSELTGECCRMLDMSDVGTSLLDVVNFDAIIYGFYYPSLGKM